MKTPKNIDVLFVAGFGPIVRDPAASRKFYMEALGLPFKEDAGGYLHTADLDGVKHFALWPLSQAAESCFGKDQWPANLPVPQAWLEFDVVNIEQATSPRVEIARLPTAGRIAQRTLGPNRHATSRPGRFTRWHYSPRQPCGNGLNEQRQLASEMKNAASRQSLRHSSMGPRRFERPTSSLSGTRSNQLSYEPGKIALGESDRREGEEL